MGIPAMHIPKVLIVDLSLQYGGSTSRVLSLLTHMPSGQAALAALEAGAIAREARRLNLPVHIVGKSKTQPSILRNLLKLVTIEQYQILDSQNIQSKFWASLTAYFSNATLISTIHSWYASEHGKTSLRGKLYTVLELATNQRLRHYITVSERDRQSLLQAGISAEKISLIYNAVDIEPEKISSDPRDLRTEFNLPRESIVCTAVGRLVAIKGFDVLIQAVQIARKQIPTLSCLIIGNGPLRQELARQIRREGLEDHLRLAGHQPRQAVLQMLKSSNIYVMPSRYEGTPIALLEAAALGLPILASKSGGIPELVRDGEHALLCPPEDPVALASGLVQLCQQESYARQLGRNAQQWVRQRFNLKAQVDATLHAYQIAARRDDQK